MEFLSFISLKNIILYVLIINIIGFLAMGIDKFKAKRGYWRIPENTLIMIAVLGGGLGDLIGMYTFRHKTKKGKFFVGIPVILVLEILIIIFFVSDFIL